MQPVEGIFLPVREIAVVLRILRSDARMPIPGLARVFQEKRVHTIRGVPSGIDVETIVSQFFGAIRQRREEMSQQTALRIRRNLPNPEKSEYMVNAEEVEVLLHVLQSGLPPCEIVLFHLVPVVCRETPHLAVCRECVRRSTGL